jgi:hypothetical protein
MTYNKNMDLQSIGDKFKNLITFKTDDNGAYLLLTEKSVDGKIEKQVSIALSESQLQELSATLRHYLV